MIVNFETFAHVALYKPKDFSGINLSQQSSTIGMTSRIENLNTFAMFTEDGDRLLVVGLVVDQRAESGSKTLGYSPDDMSKVGDNRDQ